MCEALFSADVCSVAATIWSRLLIISFGFLAKSSWISAAVWLATFSFRLIMYHKGTEADWISLDLFKLHSQDYPGPC